MNPGTLKEAKDLFDKVDSEAGDKIVICPPFVYLEELASKKKRVKLGAQDVAIDNYGPYTGEVSAPMLKSIGCEYVIVGHSERRKEFGETDEIVNQKTKAVIENGLIPIVCVGETEKEREEGKTENILEEEIKTGLKGVDLSKVIIAYEPIWAIGTGNPCDPQTAEEVREAILKMTNKKMIVLYGGSVKADNFSGYLDVGFDGLLVGGASLQPKEFNPILHY